MSPDEALAFVELILDKRSLTRVERSVFEGVWLGRSYADIAKEAGYDAGYIKLVSHRLWHLLTMLFNEKISKNTLQSVIRRQMSQYRTITPTQKITEVDVTEDGSQRRDWGEVVDITFFYGRQEELKNLSAWIEDDRCRLIAMVGMGGLGKTALSVKLAKNLEDQFDFVVWRSLNTAKPPEELLTNIIYFLSQQRDNLLQNDLDSLVGRLLEYLQRYRCLLVLDNFESVLKGEENVGMYRRGYEGYGTLLKRVGEVSHQSCLVVTSREMPEEVAMLEGDILPVRVLPVVGLDVKAAQRVLEAKGLRGIGNDLYRLVEWYRGNPLALKIAASSIKDLFSGNVSRFLEQRTLVFSGIGSLLDQQFRRLTGLEKQVMIWLAINRDPLSANDLRSDIVPTVEQSELMTALGSLKRRSLIEQNPVGFTQQPVVMEYVTMQLVDQLYREISQEQPLGVLPGIQAKLNKQLFYLRHYAVVKATAKDYLRQGQVRQIMEPLVSKLMTHFGNKQEIAQQLINLLEDLRVRELRPETTAKAMPSYGAGNILNLFWHLGLDLKDLDFSNLTIRQAYLPEVKLHNVNFSKCDLVKTVFAENMGGALSVTFSPDGHQLSIGDTRGQIHLWRVRDGKPLLIIKGHTGWVVSVAFSPDGRLLASSSVDQSIKIWDLNTGECVRTFTGFIGTVPSVAFHPEGILFASGHADRMVRIWDLDLGMLIATLEGHEDMVQSLVFNHSGTILASGSQDTTIRLWDASNGACLRVLSAHEDTVSSVSFSHNDNVLASGSEDKNICLWNVATGKCLRTLTGHEHMVFAVSFSRDGTTLASGSGDRTIRLWDIQSGQCTNTLIGHNHWVRSVAFHPTQPILATSSGDEMVKLWETQTGLCVRTFQGHLGRSWSSATVRNNFAPQTSQPENNYLFDMWDISSGQQLQILQGYDNTVSSVMFHPEGGVIASGGNDSVIRLWHGQRGICIRMLKGHGDNVRLIQFSPCGRYLASCSDDCSVKLWDIGVGNCLHSWMHHPVLPRCVAFTHDGKWLITGATDKLLSIWDVETGARVRQLEGHSGAVLSMTCLPNSDYLVTGGREKAIRLWDLSTSHCVKVWSGLEGPVTALLPHPVVSGQFFSVIGETVTLWDSQSTGEECVQRFEQIVSVGAGITAMAVNGTGELLATSTDHATIKLWSVSTGALVKSLEGHTGAVSSLAFARSGNLLVSGSRDETLRIWDLDQVNFSKVLREPRPYEGLNIKDAMGLSSAQSDKLKSLGAVEI